VSVDVGLHRRERVVAQTENAETHATFASTDACEVSLAL
jgi:hypothetical protein